MTQFSEYETHTAEPAPPPAGPRLPRREAWADLPEDAYPGFKVKFWVNYPKRLQAELRSGDEQRIDKALRQIVLEHNGWCDEDGKPYPQASAQAFWETIPDELAATLITLLGEQVGKLAASLRQRSGR
jgi:hypothetical protein